MLRPAAIGGTADLSSGVASHHALRRLVARCTAPTAFRVARNGRLVPIAAATSSGDSFAAGIEHRAAEDREAWKEGAFPSYLQSEVDDFCTSWSDALQVRDTAGKHVSLVTNDNPVWQAIRREAQIEAKEEPLLSSFYHASILSHNSFARSLAFVLANRLADATLLASELFEIFHQVLHENERIKQAALLDIVAFYERDPACTTYSAALLYFKGYHAIQTHRIANILWNSNRKVMAMALQARVSEVLAIDLHPGATLGKGLLLDHGTGVVIGETSRVGDNVSIMQNVTLGGTGKDAGNRHPKVEDNVLIGAGATVLGNITVGKGAQVAAGSLVLKDVPPKTMVAGSPARPLGKVTGNAALRMQHSIQQPEESSRTGGSSGTPAPSYPPSGEIKQQQQNSHHITTNSDSGGGGGAFPPRTAASSFADDPNCLDGTTETRDSVDLAHWAMKVASKPRNHNISAEASNRQINGSKPQLGIRWRGSATQQQQQVGGRGGVVTTLAVESEAPILAPEQLQLAPDDCEPDWLMAPSIMSRAGSQRQGGAAVDDGLAAAERTAALRRHSNWMLSEAGILTGHSGWTATLSTAADGAAAVAAPDDVASAQPEAALDPQSAGPAKPVTAEFQQEASTDYII